MRSASGSGSLEARGVAGRALSQDGRRKAAEEPQRLDHAFPRERGRSRARNGEEIGGQNPIAGGRDPAGHVPSVFVQPEHVVDQHHPGERHRRVPRKG